MRAPEFWRTEGLISKILSPIGAIYGVFARGRLRRGALRAPMPAIVVGGLTLGGDGKTPLVMALARRLIALGESPALLTRGYGRRSREEPLIVDPTRHNADAVGDEALLLSRVALTIVGADRSASAALAKEQGATVIVLDDGFHSARLAADLALLAIDADYGAGNGQCPPAGPLRAPLDAQLDAADALVIFGKGSAGAAVIQNAGKPDYLARSVADGAAFRDMPVIGFAGIGRPDRFFRSLRDCGCDIVATRAFADHHRYTSHELKELAALSQRYGARLVTTEKDAARLGTAVMRDLQIATLPTVAVFDDVEKVDARLLATLNEARRRA